MKNKEEPSKVKAKLRWMITNSIFHMRLSLSRIMLIPIKEYLMILMTLSLFIRMKLRSSDIKRMSLLNRK